MKKKIICAFLAIVMIIGCVGILASCGGDKTCTEHVDEDGDSKCDKCGEAVEGGDPSTCKQPKPSPTSISSAPMTKSST